MESEILVLLKEIQRNLSMSWKNWIPLISTLVGGILALVGSFGAQFFQSHLVAKKEVNNLLREKLETIGTLSNEFENALQVDMAQVYGVAAPTDTNIPPVNAKLQTLLLNVKLYYHELSDPAELLEKSCLNYFKEKKNIQSKLTTKAIEKLSNDNVKDITTAFVL